MTQQPTPPMQHSDVGAYALGVLDADEATRFEDHLLACERCAAELEDLMGLAPLLAEFKDSAPDQETLTADPAPRPQVLAGLLEEADTARRTRRRRRRYLVAAAAALVVGGPLATAALLSSPEGHHRSFESMARQMYEDGDKLRGTVDPVTEVAANVSLEPKPWGTHVALRLGNVKGPLTCDLIAVGKNGAEQTVTTWAVPASGYGITGASATSKWNREPLYAHGGAAMNRGDIDRFEVRTLDGRRLATVKT